MAALAARVGGDAAAPADGPRGRPGTGRLTALASTLDVRSDLRGDVSPDAVADAMQRAAVVVVPSVYREPLGLVAIEAMASGAIVVASASGGLVETVLDGVTGLSVPPGDVDALAVAIARAREIARDPVTGPAVRAAGRAMAATHDVRRSAADSISWYGTLRR